MSLLRLLTVLLMVTWPEARKVFVKCVFDAEEENSVHEAFNCGVVRQETEPDLPMSRKRLRAGWDDEYLMQLLNL